MTATFMTKNRKQTKTNNNAYSTLRRPGERMQPPIRTKRFKSTKHQKDTSRKSARMRKRRSEYPLLYQRTGGEEHLRRPRLHRPARLSAQQRIRSALLYTHPCHRNQTNTVSRRDYTFNLSLVCVGVFPLPPLYRPLLAVNQRNKPIRR